MELVTEWLGRWEEMEPPAKHDIRYPADDARGYQFVSLTGSRVPNPMTAYPTMWDRVNRAIPVDGAVSGLTWRQSPQVKYWLDAPKRTLRQRLADWMRK